MDWKIYGIWLIAASLVTFITYGYDKSQARKGGWRVRESVLHLMALAGGFIGGWFGRSVFHHKTQKAFFTFVLVIATLLHLGIGYWIVFR